MEVRVKLLLRGGHAWEFCCEDDDPIVLGLVSALPGADLGGNLPPDGLVQIETRTGERLFLTRSSLVSVEIVPVADPLRFVGTRRLAKPSQGIPPGASAPSPFWLADDALPGDVHRALIAHALGQEAAAPPAPDDARELDLGALAQPVADALGPLLAHGAVGLDGPGPDDLAFQFRLLAIGDAQAVPWDAKEEGVLRSIYHFHRQPKGFTGGGIRLFDRRLEDGAIRATGCFRDVEIGDNCLLMVREPVVGAGLPVHCPTRAFADGLFAVCGTSRPGPAGE